MKTIKRMELVCVREQAGEYNKRLSSSRDVAALLTSLLGKYDSERFLVLVMDAQNSVVGFCEVAKGGVEACAFEVRDVFRTAIHLGASSIIVSHNHPSGVAQPSEADRVVTRKIVAAGDLLGIRVLDHVIVTHEPNRYYSFADFGTLHA